MSNKQMGLIGRKIGMTQIFDDDGTVSACTIIEAGPNTVLQVKTADGPDGYNAIQLGFGTRREVRMTKALKGHLAKAEQQTVKAVREIRLEAPEVANFSPGQTLGPADVFKTGEFADVIGTSKGAGFAGVMKRYNFRGSIRSHGVHEYFRHGGSIGTRLTPGHVMKGKKMPGHMGNKRLTVQNLMIMRVDVERNLVFLRGGVPGPVGATVVVRQAVKKG